MQRVRVCRTDELGPGTMTRICVGSVGHPIAVYNVDGRFYATDDTCTHGASSLSEGWLEDDIIECGWHRGRFSVITGQALQYPATVPLKAYPVVVDGDDVFLELPDEA